MRFTLPTLAPHRHLESHGFVTTPPPQSPLAHSQLLALRLAANERLDRGLEGAA